jgi:hypothetical protein
MSILFRLTVTIFLLQFSALLYATDPPPEICEVNANECPSLVYEVPKISCPKRTATICTAALPQAEMFCDRTIYGDSYCEAWPEGINTVLHYSWTSNNAYVLPDGSDSSLQFFSCSRNAGARITVTITDAYGRTTTTNQLISCRPRLSGSQQPQ